MRRTGESVTAKKEKAEAKSTGGEALNDYASLRGKNKVYIGNTGDDKMFDTLCVHLPSENNETIIQEKAVYSD